MEGENNFNQNPGNPSQMPGMPEKKESAGVGALIGSIIVIIVLILGALYFWGREVNERVGGEAETTGEADLNSIEEGLQGSDFEGIDADFNASLDAEAE